MTSHVQQPALLHSDITVTSSRSDQPITTQPTPQPTAAQNHQPMMPEQSMTSQNRQPMTSDNSLSMTSQNDQPPQPDHQRCNGSSYNNDVGNEDNNSSSFRENNQNGDGSEGPMTQFVDDFDETIARRKLFRRVPLFEGIVILFC